MSTQLRPYPAYKDSGVPWLGMVPAQWLIARNGRLFVQRNETSPEDLPVLEVSLRTGVRVRNMEDGIRKQMMMSDRKKYKRARSGDLAYNMMRMWQGAVGVAPVDGLVSSAYVVARALAGVHASYFAHVFRTNAYMLEVDKYSHGIVKDRNRLYWEDFKQMPSPCPPPEEQAAIVRFLDCADRRIRRYIRAKRTLIALLNERKKAITSHASTRGLDANVDLKASGEAWLGEIPEHWEMRKLYRITDRSRPVMYGIVLPGPNVDEGVLIVKGGNCEPGKLRTDLLSRTSFEIEAGYARSRLRAGDIVFAIRGAVGAAEMVPTELAGANITQDAARIAAGPDVHPKWLLYAVRAPAFHRQVEARILGATVRGINIRDLKRIDVPVPPLDEQMSVAAHLDAALSLIGAGLTRLRRELDLIGAYRMRFVSDVVTGKLDVREAAGSLPDEPELEAEQALEEEAESDGDVVESRGAPHEDARAEEAS